MSDGRKLVLALGAVVVGSTWARFVTRGKYRAAFEAAGAAEGVPPNVLHALQLTENPGEDPKAIGALNNNGTRDYGLMQINARNFPRLGLGEVRSDGTPVTSAWQDPEKSVRAAAKLIASQQRAQPALTVTDHFSVYNAGFSDDTRAGLRPKLDAKGGYWNGDYVRRATTWWLLVTFADVLPIKLVGWKVT